MVIQFTQATKQKSKLRMTLDGPSGSGKTFTGLTFAFALAGPNGRVAVIDTERGSASKYAGDFPAFDVLELETYSPALYAQAIQAAEQAGYDVLLIDSLSHAWEGEGGALEMVDRVAAQSRSNNSYTAWRDVTPVHRKMVDAILQARLHIITTMRCKTEYVMETNDRGKVEPRKVGMAPIQRAGMEYEFDVVCDLDWAHKMVVSKSRISAIDGDVILKPGAEWMTPIIAWLSGAPAPERKPETEPLTQPVQTTTSAANTTNGNGTAKAQAPARPYDAETIRKALHQRIAKYEEEPPTPGDTGAMVGALNKLWPNDNADSQAIKRHALLHFVLGKNSSKLCSKGECTVIREWASTFGESGYTASPHAIVEAARMVEADEAAQGQQPLAGLTQGELEGTHTGAML